MSAATHWQGLRQRFDGLALRPPAAATATDETALAQRDAATRAALLAWCWQGAGPGGAPFWRPGGQPAVAERLRVASLQGRDVTTTSAWADQVARQLDGSLHLAALPSRAAGLAYRLGVKWHDAMWWRHRQADDPWDAGWALATPAALQQLQTGFQPRRATLVLADTGAAERLQPCLGALRQRQHGFRHPVRWLWVGGQTDLPAPQGLPVTWFVLD